MKQRDILLFVGGLVSGYFLCKVISANKVKEVATDIKDKVAEIIEEKPSSDVMPLSDEEKTSICEAKLGEATMSMRFGSVDEMNTYRNQFMADCMSSVSIK